METLEVIKNMWIGLTIAFDWTVEFVKMCFNASTTLGILVVIGIVTTIFGNKKRR